MTDRPTAVLLVEDNPADARLLRELLGEVTEHRFTVTTVGTLAAAVAAVASQEVVLLDLSLPDCAGTETLARMTHAAGDTPIVVLTGNTNDEVALAAAALGAEDYLQKGELSPSLLTRTIRYAIERRRGREAERRVLALEIARAESERSAARASFLADLSVELATRASPDEILRAVTLAVVPELADLCVADAATDGDGAGWRRIGGVGATPELQALAEGPGLFPPGLHEHPVALALSRRTVIAIPDVLAVLDDAPADAAARVQAAGVQAALVLPLVVRDNVVGVLKLACRRGRPFDEDRRAFAADVVQRTAIAIDNAMLHQANQRALRAREEMLAVVSHDLRNPLSVMSLTFAALEQAATTGAPPPWQLIRKGQRAIDRMQRLIDDLLDVARIDAGTLVVTRAPLDLAALLRESVDHHATLAAEKGITLAVEAAGELTVEGDRHRLLQLLANLVGNALKFTPAGGRVVLASTRRGEAVQVSVTDSGPGVPAESRARVFDRFFQSSRGRDGVGLGLAIARGIVDAHGGRIGVDGAEPCGARFWFELPAAARTARAVSAPAL